MPSAPEVARVALGAQVLANGVSYRVWAPDAKAVEARVNEGPSAWAVAMDREADGFWSAVDARGRAGDLYRFSLDGGAALPDVASRFQPGGVTGPSECIDPAAYGWSCGSWERRPWEGQTTYEIHVGTFTGPGTFRAAASKFQLIRDLGVEAIELMPVADFEGDRNWGYDGVALYAPARCYGRPDDLRALVDAAHAADLAVVLDVVYNHVGAQADHYERYCADFFSKGPHSPWGRSFNLDGRRSGPVRDFLKENALYWLDEFRFDGLRFDATHAIADGSNRHLIEELTEAAHARGAFVIAEDERNSARILRGPGGLDAVWADDFHHQVRVALTGIQTSYYSGYTGTADALADVLENGWTYRGQAFAPWKGKPRGEPSGDLSPNAFVFCIENHDQIGNRALGERLEHLVDLRRFRAASMLLCLSPHPVLLFMGQEWAASAPFRFFSNHGGELGRMVTEGRAREHGLSGGNPSDPEDRATFDRCKLAWEERTDGFHAATVELYAGCLRERKRLRDAGALSRQHWSVQTMGPWFAVRYHAARPERLLLGTFHGVRLSAPDLPDEMAAPPGHVWTVQFASEGAAFGGEGAQGNEYWTLDGPGFLWLSAAQPNGAHGTH
jgi:maltooligosyltrehalose trehalohydrolase